MSSFIDRLIAILPEPKYFDAKERQWHKLTKKEKYEHLFHEGWKRYLIITFVLLAFLFWLFNLPRDNTDRAISRCLDVGGTPVYVGRDSTDWHAVWNDDKSNKFVCQGGTEPTLQNGG
jgi:hypothetical protein